MDEHKVPWKVLLIDDDADIRRITQIILETEGGWSVRLAASGEEGIAMAEAELPDVILLDVMMPRVDGPETLARLRASPRTAAIPVVFLTAKVQKQEIARYLQIGGAAVVVKPFDPDTLGAEIAAVLT